MKTLLAGTAFVAICVCALLYANALWAACFFTTALASIMFGMLAATVIRGPKRVPCAGFAIFAACYFFVSIFDVESSSQSWRWTEPRLLSSKFLYWVTDWVDRQRERVIEFPGGETSKYTLFEFVSRGTVAHTLLIGHSVITVLFGVVGAAIAKWLNQRQEPKNPDNV